MPGGLPNRPGPRPACAGSPPRSRNVDTATIRQGNLKDFRAEAGRLREIYNDAWKENWGFVPFTEKEFEFMAKELKQLVLPEFTLIAEVGDEPVGFILCVPDINVAFRKINGRLTSYGIPIGLAKLLYYKSRIRTARLIALGVKPKVSPRRHRRDAGSQDYRRRHDQARVHRRAEHDAGEQSSH